ncbi:ADP-forming succinate--CoA ligase subunit beta [Desulfosudis oleivorans]|uniref:Succinate--CoA ligase [ADP-forming] subunit beta n=1 Tax=Desulfosudis oleivorans (strain DSM 6200 / JCM 39069 / Hxd3) TaxID=96561 RepID=SUCC_DESOH|nr:ADP-forming succinate--CoA ligase subunit beta [Desulfosudis oleivorans]A8ZRW7.1 RecName: Full=Succinate--CoA ligase [ADP-forming] subunit beta; AltName: Full=Succinyl-CoA synthetase subunit beta; Short=SCS-beta [Desulfosudis oleivorans Hxd3]ABW65884.1 succinyl-CoA synthetase, beta subunit [Desulfosudis oleivorans Hxd3]
MKIHEFQTKELFRTYGIPTPEGRMVNTAEAAGEAAGELGGFPVVVKAQIHAGGRGKGGGVKLAKSADEAKSLAGAMLGSRLVTPQTGPEGTLVQKVLVEQGVSIAKELYLSVVADRETAGIVIMASEAGGMDIEAVAETTPEKILKVFVNPLAGLSAFHCRQAAYGLNLPAEAIKPFTQVVSGLFKLFVDYDASLVEINPLILTTDKAVMALDAKINFDDSALFRHKDILALRDTDEEDPLEVEASRFNLNYINMDGNVGNMVNGAGLAMATMDIIKLAGAEPANFLDVGGGANAEMVENGFRIILSDPKVKCILVNIFGGILRCDVLASGIVQAARNTAIHVPLVVRMEGTNVDEGKRILAESGLDLHSAASLKDAAARVAQVVAAA